MTTKAIAQIEAAQYQVKGLREGQVHDYATGECLDMSSSMDDAANAIEHLIAYISAQDAEIERLKDYLQFVERWANHHGHGHM